MALTRVGPKHFESEHFALIDPAMVRVNGRQLRHYKVIPKTDPARGVLPGTPPFLASQDARKYVAKLERQLKHTEATIGTLPEKLETGADLIALRQALFPGLSITKARARLAKYLFFTIDHIRHMETGNRPLEPRTALMLRRYAADALKKSRAALKAEERALQPFAELYEALSTED